MKLLYQLNAAFTVLIVIVMSITAFFIYSLLMNMLIKDEQRQLEARADFFIDVVTEEDPNVRSSQLMNLLQDRDYPILLFDKDRDLILFRTMPEKTAQDWVHRYEKELMNEEVWEGRGEKYVVYDFAIAPRTSDRILVMATPINDLQAVQSLFAFRMIAVLLIGLTLAIVISYFLTRRLVTPLTRLKQELKKIEKRQFDDIQIVRSSGEIKEVEQSVRHMAEELGRYINSQKQFFQNASHELKTPLMSIQGYAEGIRDGVFEGEAAERGYQVMISEIERLKKIVNEMILLAKLDSSEDIYHSERVDVITLIRQAKDRLLPLAKDQEIDLQYEGGGSFYTNVDGERVLQAFINILSNAIRHARSKVTITTQGNSSQIVIQISDDGDGIAEELLPQLFERFMKGKEGETGLGLAISRAIIERSGGRIRAANNIEQPGAMLEVILPASD